MISSGPNDGGNGDLGIAAPLGIVAPHGLHPVRPMVEPEAVDPNTLCLFLEDRVPTAGRVDAEMVDSGVSPEIEAVSDRSGGRIARVFGWLKYRFGFRKEPTTSISDLLADMEGNDATPVAEKLKDEV